MYRLHIYIRNTLYEYSIRLMNIFLYGQIWGLGLKSGPVARFLISISPHPHTGG